MTQHDWLADQFEPPGERHWVAFLVQRGGLHWSAAIQAPSDQLDVPHIMEVGGGDSGIAYVTWLANSDSRGYAPYMRTFSITRGWLSAPFQVSTQFGDPLVWPGDMTGLSTLGANQVSLSWGSAVDAKNKNSEICSATVSVQLR